ncbi:nucleoside triphosphate pyrophosphatase [Halanaerobium sp. MA284_MarDTE_T2]|uniref:Maf family protein n=1 Tax=Halanaerobium sp. MA284_MarDTE_T2 TaxID=2183913 RepID=UPI000DF2978C|nr:Maf family protein [Halanaerobium sp. MA284_MarDTE_T2]RCW49699.1 septum formation protein [Halanaerobium sp. MA284_MarDTE_T2]
MGKLVLASASPRREELLKQLKLQFTIVPSRIDESQFNGLKPVDMVEKLAFAKAESVSELVEEAIIIAADTVIVAQDRVLNKPEDAEDAKNMLSALSGKEHQVITGVAVMNSETDEYLVEHNITSVFMEEISEEEIDKYLETGEPMDKAGAYAIQGFGSLFVREIKGSYYSVVGLPLNQLSKMLKKFNYGIL